MYDQKFGIRHINRRSLDFFAELDEQVNFIPSDWKFDQLAAQKGKGLIQ